MAQNHYLKLMLFFVTVNVRHILAQTDGITIDLTTNEHLLGPVSVGQNDHLTVCINASFPLNVPFPHNATIFLMHNVNGTRELTINVHITEIRGLYEIVQCHPACTPSGSTIHLSQGQWRTIKFVLPEIAWLQGRIKILCEDMVCENVTRCETGENGLVREKRQVLEINNDNNDTNLLVTETTSSVNQTEESTTPSTGLSKGALAAAIVVPILIVILAAVGGYFLYRWLRSRRTEHGVYQPKEMENQGNLSKQPDPQSVIKLPPEERLI